MRKIWPRVQLGDLLRRSDETIPLRPDATYREITVRLWGKGVVPRGVVAGVDIAAPRRYLVRDGMFILSRIDARNGALGIVPPELDGSIATNDFPVFRLQEDRLQPAYLGWLCRTAAFVEECRQASEGTTNRVRLQEDRFLSGEISLPPLSEQQRIVERIEDLAAKIHEARALRREVTVEAAVLVASQLGTRFACLSQTFPIHPLGELTSHIVDGPHKTPQYLLPGSSGIPFVTVKNMVSGTLSFADLNYISEDDHRVFARRCRAEYGDVLYSKDGATRGHPCFVSTEREFSYFVSVALIKPLRDRLDGRYLVHFLSSSWIRERMTDRSRGDMIPHIVLGEIRAFPVPLPPLEQQRHIVEEMDALQAQVDSLRQMQTEATAEIDALLPAILDRAFKGEL